MTLLPGSGKTEQLLVHSIQRKLGMHRGARRLWLEGKRLTDVGFKNGIRYQKALDAQGALTLRLTPAGDHKVSGDARRPVVDLHLSEYADAETVYVSFEKRAITVRVIPSDGRWKDTSGRLAALNARLGSGQAWRLGSLCHGGGIASDAMLRGLGGQLTFANERDEHYMRQSFAHGPLAQGGMSIEGDLGDIDPSVLPECDILEAGLPCTAASRAGKAKKGLDEQEDEEALADLVVAFLEVIRATSPAVVILENVPEYADSATAKIIRARLRRFGYVISERIVQGSDYALEARQRWIMVACIAGLDFNLEALAPTVQRPAALGEVLDKRPLAGAWKSTASFDKKAARDKAKGNGFSRGRRFLEPSATSVPTLRRGYQKGGNTDVRLAHPTRAGYARLFSAAEHARIKGIDPALVAGLSEKKAHEILGQSVIAPSFTALGALVGRTVR